MAGKQNKPQKLNLRERKFMKNLSLGMTQREAAIKAGYSKKSADSIASQKIKEIKVAGSFCEILDKHGVTDDAIASVISEGIKAKRHVMVGDDVKELPDWIARHKFSDSALKVKGHLRDKVDVNLKGNVTIEIIKFSPERDGTKDR